MTLPPTRSPDFSDCIVFADESGDHGLERIDPHFPIFALALCVVRIEEYINSIVPKIQRFKFSTWGHDNVVLHEHEIRKGEKDFAFLHTTAPRRERFLTNLSTVMADTQMSIIATVIDKHRLTETYEIPRNPYEISLLFCMERLLETLLNLNQSEKRVYIVFESRGKREDQELESEFRLICANQSSWDYQSKDFSLMSFEPVFVSKAANSIGLQLADLVARPIALSVLRPNQANRAYDTIKPKICERKIFP